MTPRSTGDDPEPTRVEPDPPRPSRPAAVELAGALLIVGGTIGVVGALTAISTVQPGTERFLALTVALDVGAIVVGLLVRLGRAWILAVNYVAVLGFLDLLGAGASPLSFMLGLVDVVVLLILFRHKTWFDELRLRRASA